MSTSETNTNKLSHNNKNIGKINNDIVKRTSSNNTQSMSKNLLLGHNLYTNKIQISNKFQTGQIVQQETIYDSSINEINMLLANLKIYQEEPTSPINNQEIQYKKSGNTRFLFQNVNSLRPKTMDKWKASIQVMKELDCDIIGICETCVNWKYYKLKKKYQSILNTTYPKASLVTTTTSQNYDKPMLPGGVATIITGGHTNKIEETIYDNSNLGRWCGTTLRLNKHQRLHIINAYRVCSAKITANNSLSTYSQQYHMLLKKGKINPNPRNEFLKDFTTFIKQLLEKKDDLILIGIDANESLTDKNSEIMSLLRECKLIDVYSEKNGPKEFGTHINGSKRIDFIICNEGMIPYIEQVQYLPFHQAIDSDHRACYCDISAELFKNNNTINLRKERLIGTNSTNAEGEKYVKHLDYLFKMHRIYDKINQLHIQSKDPENLEAVELQLNKLDTIITESMLLAEKKNCKKKQKALWSPELQQSNLTIQYWNILCKAEKQLINVTDRLSKILSKMSSSTAELISNNQLSHQSALKNALKQHNVLLENYKNIRKNYLERLLKDINEREDTNKTTLKSLITRELSRTDFSFIRIRLKDINGKGITYITTPDDKNPHNWITVSEVEEMIKVVIKRNVKHFGQANDTPFAIPPLCDIYMDMKVSMRIANN
jgi:hypothetical protein